MKILSIDNVKPGMINGRTVMGFSNQNLLAAGTPLTEDYLARLKELGITSLYIIDEHTDDIEVDDIVCEQTRIEAGQLAKEIMDKTKLGKEIDHRRVKQIINLIIEDLLENKELLIKLIDIRSLNDYNYFHSVNVSILSGVIGIKLGYSNTKLQELMLGALFHDLGKTLLTG